MKIRLLILSCFFFLVACNNEVKEKNKQLTDTTAALKGSFHVSPDLSFDSLELDSFLQQRPDFEAFKDDFKQFYKLHDYHYVWYDKSGIIESAHNLISRVQTQEDEGVFQSLPYREEFLRMITLEADKSKQEQPTIAVELMLTAQYFNYAKNSWGGGQTINPAEMGWYLPRKQLSYPDLLQRQLSLTSENIEQEAVIPQYTALREELNRYQQLEKNGKDVLVSKDDLVRLNFGDSASVVRQLGERLSQLGDLSKDSIGDVFNEGLKNAIQRFKKRHGIPLDAKLGGRFVSELNTPFRKRIEQLIVNLERMRWIPLGDHGERFVLVNIPAYHLYYYEDSKLTWDCKVVVGKQMNQTVIFGGNIQYVVFSPYWYVPPSIIQKEITPAMRRNPNYLAEHRMEWNGGQVRQKPGPGNSLGLVKFIFPNANNIYLHDTPSKTLFSEDSRAFSHGCIRVERPKELAQLLLKDIPAWTPEKIQGAMQLGKERWVSLPKKVPVYIGYFTAYVDSQGLLNFRDDVYHLDQRLLKMMME